MLKCPQCNTPVKLNLKRQLEYSGPGRECDTCGIKIRINAFNVRVFLSAGLISLLFAFFILFLLLFFSFKLNFISAFTRLCLYWLLSSFGVVCYFSILMKIEIMFGRMQVVPDKEDKNNSGTDNVADLKTRIRDDKVQPGSPDNWNV